MSTTTTNKKVVEEVKMEVDDGEGDEKATAASASAASSTKEDKAAAAATETATTTASATGSKDENVDDKETAGTDNDVQMDNVSGKDKDNEMDKDNPETSVSGKKRPRSPSVNNSSSSSSKNGDNSSNEEALYPAEVKKRQAMLSVLEEKKTGAVSSSTDAAAASASASTATTTATATTNSNTTTSTTVSTNRDSEKISVSSIAAASQLSSSMGWNGLANLLSFSLLTNNGNSVVTSSSHSNSNNNERTRGSSNFRMSPAGANNPGGSSSSGSGASSSSSNHGSLPSKEQVLQAAIKAVNDAPPFVHLSKTDSAPQLRITNSELPFVAETTNEAIGAVASESNSNSAAAKDVAAAAAASKDDAPGNSTTAAKDVTAAQTTTNTTNANANANANATNPTPAAPTTHHLVNDRLACKQGEGEMRGYRMTRGSHGVTPGSGHYYYEVVVLQPPTARDLVNSLPPNVRLGKKLQKEMQDALKAQEEEEEEENKAKAAANSSNGSNNNSSNNKSKSNKHGFGAHVRLGWSMRTGDLQAPVGYDKWSYGVRDIQGSKIHCSRREDNWGGEEFGPGDVIGCAISMVSDGTTATSAQDETVATAGNKDGNNPGTKGGDPQDHSQENNSQQQQQQQQQAAKKGNENNIRFFKNGYPMGEFIITKGKREGGVAFVIPDGVYYPAISLYMGATVKVNLGPHFIHPPRKLPTVLSSKYSRKKQQQNGGSNNPFRPISSLSKPPLTVQEASAKVTKEQKTLFFRKADNSAQQKRFLELVETEVSVLQEAYKNHRRKHLLDVMEERKRRNLKCDDLEQDDFFVAAAAAAPPGSSSTDGGTGGASTSS